MFQVTYEIVYDPAGTLSVYRPSGAVIAQGYSSSDRARTYGPEIPTPFAAVRRPLTWRLRGSTTLMPATSAVPTVTVLADARLGVNPEDA